LQAQESHPRPHNTKCSYFCSMMCRFQAQRSRLRHHNLEMSCYAVARCIISRSEDPLAPSQRPKSSRADYDIESLFQDQESPPTPSQPCTTRGGTRWQPCFKIRRARPRPHNPAYPGMRPFLYSISSSGEPAMPLQCLLSRHDVLRQ
jgi:hypothetical protein